MGTRSLTEVRNRWMGQGDYETNAVVFRHYDGYPSCHGNWLVKFLDGLHVVNGITVGDSMPKRYANGAGRLATMLVRELDRDGHDPSLLPKVASCGDHEYHYRIDIDEDMDGGTFAVTVFSGYGEKCTEEIFTGNVDEFASFIESQ